MHACMASLSHQGLYNEVIALSVRQLYSLDPACGAELSSQRSSTAQPGSNEGSQPY
jgi:hypothetical protein